MKKKLIFGFFVFGAAFWILTNKALASGGDANLRNIVGDSARCTAHSVLMQDLQYKILLDCRDITYPGGTDIFNYVVWINPVDGGSPKRLGTVGLGKAEFRTNEAFSSIFVSKEKNASPNSPQGEIVMQGNLQRNQFLDQAPPPDETELGTPEASPTPAPKKNALSVLRLGGAIGFVALVGIIIFVLFITRK